MFGHCLRRMNQICVCVQETKGGEDVEATRDKGVDIS